MTNGIPAVNNVELDRERLVNVLEYFGYRVGERFSHPISLVVHGGACMLLHPGLYNLAEQQAKLTPNMPIRKTTRDVDYIHRAFVNESLGYGELDAPKKLEKCIKETASKFGLGLDWMNSAADVALPMAVDPSGRPWDPIYAASALSKSNIESHTIFSSANGMLKLIGVPPFWAIALKLVRYTKWDPSDICFLLKYVTIRSGAQWNRENLEELLQRQCWTMGYAKYTPEKKQELRSRIDHAIMMVNAWYAKTPTLEEFSPTAFRTDAGAGNHLAKDRHMTMDIYARRDLAMGTMGLDRNQAEWGGGDRSGWKASFAGDWIKPDASPPQVHPPFLNQQQAPQHLRHSHSMNLSPLFDPHAQPLRNLDSFGQRRVTENVADWAAEKRREKRSQERNYERRDKEQAVVEPFIPTLPHTGDHPGRFENGDALGLGEQRKAGSVPRARSQPPAPVYPIYYPPPQPPMPVQHHPSFKYADPPTQSNPHINTIYSNTYNPHPQPNAHQPSPQHVWHGHSPAGYYIPPMKLEIKMKRKEKGKARDKSRDRARSAKWKQDFSIDADGTYTFRLSEQSSKTKNKTHEEPQKSMTPVIYPLTTVVYYNQQQDAHTSSLTQSSSPQPSPPHQVQNHRRSATSIASGWSPPTTANASGMATQTHIQPTPGYSMYTPPGSRIYTQAVIPPEEYTNPERSNGALHKLMSALKI